MDQDAPFEPSRGREPGVEEDSGVIVAETLPDDPDAASSLELDDTVAIPLGSSPRSDTQVVAVGVASGDDDFFLADDGLLPVGANDPTLEGTATEAGSWLTVPMVRGYEILGELNRGGMGVVYKARQVRLNRPCALKMLLGGLHASAENAVRFLHEAETIARLQHPNIVQVYHVGDQDGRLFIEMEYVGGGNLAAQLDGTPRPARIAARMIETLARAIQAVHALGVVHRDLKPANILIDAQGTLKITDFGLAKTGHTDTGLTQTEVIMGSPSYMAPEQAEGKNSDLGPIADIYSLGAILYELVTGRPPFRGPTVLQTLELVRSAEPVPPSQLQPDLPRDLETICLRCLQKEPARRYPTAEELAEDLRRFQDGEPIVARRAGWVERFLCWRRRNPAIAALAAAIVLLLVTATVGSSFAALWMRQVALRADRDRGVAQHAQGVARDALRQAEITLADMHTSQGLMAAGRNQSAQALLWFANAARIALGGTDPDRERANRVRVHSWGRKVVVPVRALNLPGQEPAALTFRPGGRHLLVLTREGRCFVWDWLDERLLPWARGETRVGAACWSPDGATLALADKSGGVEIRRVPDGEVVARLVHPGPVTALAFSRDGRSLALGGSVVRVWEARSRTFTPAAWFHPRPVTALVFNARGDRVATACQDQTARVFALESGESRAEPLFPPVPHRPLSGTAPVFLDRDRGLVTITDGREATWWDAETGATVRRLPFDRGTGGLNRLLADADGTSLALVGWGGVQTWRVSDPGRPGPFLEHRHLVTDAAYAPDAPVLLTVSSDRTARLWSLGDGKPLTGPLARQADSVAATFSSEGVYFATAQRNGLVRVCRRAIDGPRDFEVAFEEGALAVTLSADCRYAVATRFRLFNWSYDIRHLQVYEVATGHPAGPNLTLAGTLRDAALAPDGRAVVAASVADGRSWLESWDVRSGRPTFAPVALPGDPQNIAVRPDGAALAVINQAGEVVILDAAHGRVLQRFRHSETMGTDHPISIAYTPDGRTLVTVGSDSTVGVWDPAQGRRRFPAIRPGGTRVTIAVAPDGRHLATSARDGVVRVWDLESGRPVSEPLRHSDWVFQARFSPDSRLLIAGCRDGQALLWDWKAARLVCPPFPHDDEVWSVDFTPDGRWGLTAGRDQVARVWEFATGKPVSPALPLHGQGTSIQATLDSRQAIVGAVGALARSIDLSSLADPDRLSLDDLCLLGELVSGQQIYHGNPAGLTTDEWLERWRTFHQGHPSFGVADRETTLALDRTAAERQMGQGHWSEAVAHLNALVAARPGDPLLRVLRGRALSRLGRPEKADDDLESALKRAGNDPAAWVAIGRALAERGRPERADAAFARAAHLAPRDPQVFLKAGWWVAGPYPEELKLSCPPESHADPSRRGLSWRDAAGERDGRVDLGPLFGRADHISAYALAYVYSEGSKPVTLLAGSDDTMRIWLNGGLVHESPRNRIASPGQDRIRVTLAPGRNTLLVKVGNSTVDHLFYLTIAEAQSSEAVARATGGS